MTSMIRHVKVQHDKYVVKLSCLEADFGSISRNDKESFVLDFVRRFYDDCLHASIDKELLPPKGVMEILFSFLIIAPAPKIPECKVDEAKTDVDKFEDSESVDDTFRVDTSYVADNCKDTRSYKDDLNKLEEKLLKLRSFCEQQS